MLKVTTLRVSVRLIMHVFVAKVTSLISSSKSLILDGNGSMVCHGIKNKLPYTSCLKWDLQCAATSRISILFKGIKSVVVELRRRDCIFWYLLGYKRNN